ncbi:TPA: hypothetical protein ACSVPQ_002740 [Clostridioides difficile]|uniref:hypothetical protein n=1 Tax=Clostridioides difficile TaxID=1496 RepID=UPI00016C6339|nr:hypothetical protein [Clostridioides difficile]MCW0773242.1 hypothetical protein [Clostridioides difficile]MDI2978199.1 hypothetical protein [Clostridioides difficile]MDI6151141.1 hypothetical protein [Clostridioides difficile]MDI7827592.1 hypothetical protein [Clostridioides difficile]MDU8820131.1 hypothetical protein [Clostridioides difficile]
MDVNMLKWISALCAFLIFIPLVRNMLRILFHQEDESLHKKRLKQLQKTEKRKSEQEKNKEFIEKITTPVSTYILPKIDKKKDLTQLEKDLKMCNWDKYFTPATFISLDITMKILAVIIGLIVYSIANLILALLWGSIIFFILNFLLKNAVKEKKLKILSGFPDFINVVQGFLVSDMTLVKAIESSIPYVGTEWSKLAQEFVIDSKTNSQEKCIEIIYEKIDIFEVRELWSLIKLNSEQGINIKECFSNQAKKITDLNMELIHKKINTRQIMATLVQAPLLLLLLIAISLPMVSQMLIL